MLCNSCSFIHKTTTFRLCWFGVESKLKLNQHTSIHIIRICIPRQRQTAAVAQHVQCIDYADMDGMYARRNIRYSHFGFLVPIVSTTHCNHYMISVLIGMVESCVTSVSIYKEHDPPLYVPILKSGNCLQCVCACVRLYSLG